MRGFLPKSPASHTRQRSIRASAFEGDDGPLERYDGPAIEAYYRQRPLQVLNRALAVGPPLLAWWAGVKLDNATAWAAGQDEKERRDRRRALQLREALVTSGSVAFIKTGTVTSR